MSYFDTTTGYNFSAISDKWYDVCHTKARGGMIGITETYRRTIHYDAIVTIIAIILIILPMLFKIYGFGLQTQLRNFYNRLVLNFCFYENLIGLGALVCSIFHIYINQQPACLRWDKNKTYFLRGQFRSPSPDLVTMTILASAIISYTPKFKIARYSIATIILVLDIFAQIYGGLSSYAGAVSSVALEFWVICFSKFVPPCTFTAFNIVVIILALSAVIYSSIKFEYDADNNRDSHYLAIRGMLAAIMAQVFYVNYGLSREDFNWMGSDWTEELEENDSDSGAEIPKMDTGAKTVDFGKVLNGDLYCGCIDFIIFLSGNIFLGMYPNMHGYSFFN
ncbi:hypothetical protein TVAG_093890 [Trichomonas vaginalis G3]|uniref:Uncharacterized protein n=1 Tax=Trichomonas vaginalis (strain ATCC PRA-98 / G3) TaxID=412133 RepID=A2DBL2_TRIV3|nr:hypothetical protein TVAGG3_0381760 [Trichomonas vaginalis G3]EAY22215.1 hypothetical protein TVAG_093890 [Trichomonas vaginalis G3]KAI5533327.1 hypothetical protein TVAGG3_0381760 [Trichomonas vaginalis G3]|eukprot:XP_001583201.1 hypothetical protein [Trichomonas vaginalis G3]